jgi:polyhydroxyalkanoate synthase
MPASHKVTTADEAIALIRSGDTRSPIPDSYAMELPTLVIQTNRKQIVMEMPQTDQNQRPGVVANAARKVLDQLDPVSFGRSLFATAMGLARHPLSTLTAYQHFVTGAMTAAGAVAGRMMGSKAPGPVAPTGKDRRFTDSSWEDNPLFFGLMQAYLLRERLALELVDAASLDPQTAQKARFVTQLIVDALAPTNYLLTNPTALRRAFETGGLSLLKGLQNFGQDLRLRGGWPKQVDAANLGVGKQLAITPGKVIYKNNLMELIQYAPQTPTTFEIPLLCSPPWINKYYIMDLAPGRSFIEWAIQHGHTTFTISYRNPDVSMREIAFEDYLSQGLYEATRVVREITGVPKINIVGLCLGGTLTSMFLAYLAELKKDWANAITLLNTLVDFSEPGPIGAFIDSHTVELLKKKVQRRGFLDAPEMSRTFNLLRAKDLVFNYVASNWLMGDEPPGFDILVWNSDSTRMPAKMYSSYLHSCYQENQLARGEMVVDGKRLDLSKVKQDVFILAAVEDHIAPWRSSFKTTSVWGGKVQFVLSSAGHIAGVVNPPSKTAVHWTNNKHAADPDTWLASATKHQETWWEEWARWMSQRAGAQKPPPPMGSDAFPPLGDAPGSYVMLK